MKTDQFSQHISRGFNAELEHLRNEVLRMGGMVENHLDIAIEAIVAGDSELGLTVAKKDHLINQMEVAIDEECSRILAIRGPAAADLRLIVAVIKTITDLERVGDEAQKIGYLASQLASSQLPSRSSAGASKTSSSCTWRSIRADRPESARAASTASMAVLMRSAAVPWMTVFTAMRSAALRCTRFLEARSGR